MYYLFTHKGQSAISEFCTPKALFAFDFDGTLTKITGNPSKVRLTQKTLDLLLRLHAVARVAIITGRGVKDLKKHLPFSPLYTIGNHGLEGLAGGRQTQKICKKTCAQWKKNIKKITLSYPGVYFEDKTFSLSIHYRHTVNRKKTLNHFLQVAHSLKPSPRIVLGKCVINLLPKEALHKGDAIKALIGLSRSKKSIYIGDDVTDEDVFKIKNKNLLSIRVGKNNQSKAAFYIKNQSEINSFLKFILTQLKF